MHQILFYRYVGQQKQSTDSWRSDSIIFEQSWLLCAVALIKVHRQELGPHWLGPTPSGDRKIWFQLVLTPPGGKFSGGRIVTPSTDFPRNWSLLTDWPKQGHFQSKVYLSAQLCYVS